MRVFLVALFLAVIAGGIWWWKNSQPIPYNDVISPNLVEQVDNSTKLYTDPTNTYSLKYPGNLTSAYNSGQLIIYNKNNTSPVGDIGKPNIFITLSNKANFDSATPLVNKIYGLSVKTYDYGLSGNQNCLCNKEMLLGNGTSYVRILSAYNNTAEQAEIDKIISSIMISSLPEIANDDFEAQRDEAISVAKNFTMGPNDKITPTSWFKTKVNQSNITISYPPNWFFDGTVLTDYDPKTTTGHGGADPKSNKCDFYPSKDQGKIIYSKNLGTKAGLKVVVSESEEVVMGVKYHQFFENDAVSIYCWATNDMPTIKKILSSVSKNTQIPVTGKPVIYLYPQATQKITVKLYYQGKLETTYPKYNPRINGWTVIAYPDGKIIDTRDNREYSYIFWDGISELNDFRITEGFVIEGDKTQEFLQKILPEMGLVPKEYNEFISYWLPKLEKNKYNAIYFSGKEYENMARLEINPKPDSILRIYMVYEALERPILIRPQLITPFARKGFTVVEWGGREF